MTIVYTARISTRDRDRLDVTWKGARSSGAKGGHRGVGSVFAPKATILYPLLRARREGDLTDEEWARYEAAYTEQMRASYRDHRDAWDTVLSWPRVVLCCFCTDHERCHRTLLGKLLARCGADFRGELVDPQLTLGGES